MHPTGRFTGWGREDYHVILRHIFESLSRVSGKGTLLTATRWDSPEGERSDGVFIFILLANLLVVIFLGMMLQADTTAIHPRSQNEVQEMQHPHEKLPIHFKFKNRPQSQITDKRMVDKGKKNQGGEKEKPLLIPV
jgi:hypothetical protein